MPGCKCARCKGRLVKDRQFDLPRKIHEFFCINCGERFWMEATPHSTDPDPPAPTELRPQRLQPAGWSPANLQPARN